MHGMFDPSRRTTGRGLLIFAVIMLGFGLVLGIAEQAWREAALWLSIAVFMACYGLIMLGVPERFHRLFLVLGLLAGAAALWLAVTTSLART